MMYSCYAAFRESKDFPDCVFLVRGLEMIFVRIRGVSRAGKLSSWRKMILMNVKDTDLESTNQIENRILSTANSF